MDLRLVEIFCCVYEHLSFSKAAEALGLSQPTVSGHVKALEASFGAPLFDRLGRGIEPTAAGELLYGYGRQIAATKASAREAMDRFLHRLEGRLHLGASTIPGEYLLPALLARFRELHPGIAVTLTIHDTREIVDQIRGGELELGFVGAALEEPALTFRPFAGDEVVLAAPKTSAWESCGNLITLDELQAKPLLMREPGSGTRMALEHGLHRLGYAAEDFDVVAELGSTAAVKEAIKAGVGAAFLSDLSLGAEIQAGWIRRIRVPQIEPLRRTFFTVSDTRRTPSPLVESFLEFLDLRDEKVA